MKEIQRQRSIELEQIARHLHAVNDGLEEIRTQMKRAAAILRAAKDDPRMMSEGSERVLAQVEEERARLRRFYAEEIDTIRELDEILVAILRRSGD